MGKILSVDWLWMQPYCSRISMILLRVWPSHPNITAGSSKTSDVGRWIHSCHSMHLNLGRWPLKNSPWRTTSGHMTLTAWFGVAGGNRVFELRASGYCCNFRNVQTLEKKIIWEVILSFCAPQNIFGWVNSLHLHVDFPNEERTEAHTHPHVNSSLSYLKICSQVHLLV